jgi:hypothetical protein
VLVVGVLVALGRADVASFGTRLTDGGSQRPVPGNDLCRGRAEFRTICTGLERVQVVLLARSGEFGAVVSARLTLAQAIGAYLRAPLEKSGMLVIRLLVICRQESASQEEEPQ